MQKDLSIKLLPSEAANESIVKKLAAASLGIPSSQITGYQVTRKSIDARGRKVYFLLTIRLFINEPFEELTFKKVDYPEVRRSDRQVVIIGAGPAGLFAALRLIESGVRPILLERGKDVRARRRDLARINKEGMVNPESNYCFGEGGAGTYSDGKLYTRSHKRGDVQRILNLFCQFGASTDILVDAHPHIGTNKLPHIITTMREQIIACGGEIHFEQKMVDFDLKDGRITRVRTEKGDFFDGQAFILATGHSARDIFELLHHKKVLIEAKSFALGVRIEHPQSLIDSIQYHAAFRGDYLPPASYSLVQQVDGRGVFSFCMCPGGIIAPAATSPGEIVVNGWSPSKRNNPYSNSGIVVAVEPADFQSLEAAHGPLSAMAFQRSVEQKAFQAGGGELKAPATRMTDFVSGKLSSTLPDCSYLPGLQSAGLKTVLPGFIYNRLASGFVEFGKKMKGYYTEEAVVVATESRTSSPVRIPRDPVKLSHPQINNLFPCAEGAGYAGGIVSAAMDGERIAVAVFQKSE